LPGDQVSPRPVNFARIFEPIRKMSTFLDIVYFLGHQMSKILDIDRFLGHFAPGSDPLTIDD